MSAVFAFFFVFGKLNENTNEAMQETWEVITFVFTS